MTIDDSFRTFVRTRREGMGLSQAALAKRMTERGVSFIQSQIQKIESGARPVSLAEAVELFAILGDDPYLDDRLNDLRTKVSRLAAEADTIAIELRCLLDVARYMSSLSLDRSSSEG